MKVSGTATVRRYRPADTDPVAEILRDTLATVWLPAMTDEARAGFDLDQRAREFIQFCGPATLIAELDGEIAGVAVFNGDFVDALHVHSRFRRTGVGSALLDGIEDAMRSAGETEARLETDTFNHGSRAFYEARGYTEAGRYPDQEWNSGFTTILFVKTL